MNDEQINKMLSKGNSKSYIVNLVYQKLRMKEGSLSNQQKKTLFKEAILIVERAMKKSFS